MPQLNGSVEDNLGANDEMISFKEEGEREEKISNNSSTESDLADLKSSLVNDSETNQNTPSNSVAIRRPQPRSETYREKPRECLGDAAKWQDGGLLKTPPYPGYPFIMIPDLASSYLPIGSLSPTAHTNTKVPLVQPPHRVHPLRPLITYRNEHCIPGNPLPHLLSDMDPRTGLSRHPHPPDVSPYYPLSPGAVGQIPHPLGWLLPQQGQGVYPITTGGIRHPYPTGLAINASMSRFPPQMMSSHHSLRASGFPHSAMITSHLKQEFPHGDVSSLNGLSQHESKREKEEKNQPHIKKPLNAFMLYMKEMRATVISECTLKESAAINQILGRRWHALSRDQQAKYYELAKKERMLHMQLYPGWSARDNYGKKKKRKRDKLPGETHDYRDYPDYPTTCLALHPIADLNTPMKCQALFGLDHQTNLCGPCRRKKKCIRYRHDEGNGLCPPSTDGSILDSPSLAGSPTTAVIPQNKQL